MEKITTIVAKEWAEVFKNRLVLFTVIFLPLIMVALPLVTLAFMGNIDEAANETTNDVPDEFFGDLCAGISESDCVQIFMLDIYTLMLMIIPVVIPSSIAAYSIVGEKAARTLEPLLATPITTLELLIGKSLAAVLPAIGATWLAFFIYLFGIWLMVNETVFQHVIGPTWLLAIFIVSPLLTLLSVSFGIIVSSRVTDPRVAEQLSAIVIMPIILLVIGQSVGLILIDERTVFLLGLVVAVLDVVLVYLSIKLFQRETILTRWK